MSRLPRPATLHWASNSRPLGRLGWAVFSLASAALLTIGMFQGLVGEETSKEKPLHWTFRRLEHQPLPVVRDFASTGTPVDYFVMGELEKHQLALSRPTTRLALARRATIDLLGTPPSVTDLRQFAADDQPDAFDRLIDRSLASPGYGERWGKYWLDAVGYSDSNGYFNADSERPLAYQYRDYVIHAINQDMPFDQFVREQLAGDEIAGLMVVPNGETIVANKDSEQDPERTRELLIATHFLRNAQDGTTESDGNPDELIVDRATPLEGCVQITINSLLGLTIQCVRCHTHKFEKIDINEYYGLQSVFYPAFPAFHADRWVKPRDRLTFVASESDFANWKKNEADVEQRIAALRSGFRTWWKETRPAGAIAFEDDFDGRDEHLEQRWTNQVPGDDAPAGTPAVAVDRAEAPGAVIRDGHLVILESGSAGDRWLATQRVLDWTPDKKGDWIQVSFDIVDNKAEASGQPAERIAFCIALHDFNDNSSQSGGNILIDGNPAGGAMVHLDYPGDDSKSVGQIGAAGYTPGHNFGLRITNIGDDKFRLNQIVDGLPDGKDVTLKSADLPDGAFGFEYCCNRSFVVDNVLIEGAGATDKEAYEQFAKQLGQRQKELESAIKAETGKRTERPGKLAMVSDVVSPVPDVFVLSRGNYKSPGDKVGPSGLRALSDGAEWNLTESASRFSSSSTSGRRLAFANWLTRNDSRSASLLARVAANRMWQYHFGIGIVPTAGNLGESGAAASHPGLLNFLAKTYVDSGWSGKRLQRLILLSAVYQQESVATPQQAELSKAADPYNRLLWRFPLRRMDAESVRDVLLSISGELDGRMYGPYTPTQRNADGGVVVAEEHGGSRRRAVYLQQRRSQVESFLEVFDSPAMVTTCPQRSVSTVPLQSLALLNSDWIRRRADLFSKRVMAAGPDEGSRIREAFWIAIGRDPTTDESAASAGFVADQRKVYGEDESKAWVDFCQMLMASNAVMYCE